MMKKILTGIAASMLFAASSFAQAPASTTASASASSGAPTDPQIAEIVVVANNGDINNAKVAKSISKNKEVRNFAQEMITDHTSANKKVAALANKLKIKPQQSAGSKKLKESAQQDLLKIKRLTGAEFDQAYIDNEVALHQTVLDTIDNTLIPNAKNQELKDLLTSVRSVIANHLEHAKKVKASLK
jgi:putative membrane protein